MFRPVNNKQYSSNGLGESIIDDAGIGQEGYYYLDIETVPLNHYINEIKASLIPSMCKIVSIQYQYLNYRTGKPIQNLSILKELEHNSSERTILEYFYKRYVENRSKWHFIPVGNNLDFEFLILRFKLEQYFGHKAAIEFVENKPKLDLKDTLVMMNGCIFKDYSAIIGKSHKAKDIALWYITEDFDAIEKYIIEEAEDFVNSYSIILGELIKTKKILMHYNTLENPFQESII